MPPALKLYIDYASQPSRAILAFCLLNKIEHTVVETRIAKMEHKSPEFLKINPEGQVPAIDDGGFCLAESHAILRYLCQTRAVSAQWYPSDAKQRAKVDQYLDWHHTHLRKCASLVFKTCFAPSLLNQKFTREELAEEEKQVKRALWTMEKTLQGQKYLCSNEMSIADLSASHELDMLKFLRYDLSKWPNVEQWLHRCIDENAV